MGLYIKRVEKSIVKLKPDRITLIVTKEPKKNKKWREVTQQNCEKIMENIAVFYDESDVKVEEITVENYRKSLVGLWQEIRNIRKEIPESRIWIDVTSAPKAFTIAAALVTTFFNNVILRYIKSKKGKDPDQYADSIKSDPGGVPQEWHLPKIGQLGEIEKKVLVTLHKKGDTVQGSKELLDSLGFNHSKSGRIKLGRLLSKLEKKALITQTRFSGREKLIELTEAGRALGEVSSNLLE